MNAGLWPPILGMVGTLLKLIVGFGLSEASLLLRTRREDRRTLARPSQSCWKSAIF
jgi:hypothetical protein